MINRIKAIKTTCRIDKYLSRAWELSLEMLGTDPVLETQVDNLCNVLNDAMKIRNTIEKEIENKASAESDCQQKAPHKKTRKPYTKRKKTAQLPDSDTPPASAANSTTATPGEVSDHSINKMFDNASESPEKDADNTRTVIDPYDDSGNHKGTTQDGQEIEDYQDDTARIKKLTMRGKYKMKPDYD